MARKKIKTGACCICRKPGTLSYEHVPPQAAFNKARAIEYRLEDVVYKTGAKGRIRQGGIGEYTLCKKCNNDTGTWYGNEYVQWARIAQDIIMTWQNRGQTQGTVTLYKVYPLRFLKQVITCFFSVIGGPSGAAFAQNNPDLVNFVLNTHEKNLPDYHVFLDLYPYSAKHTSLRRYPLAGKLTVIYDEQGHIMPIESHALHEITHPPFALTMTSDGTFFGATNITQFKNFNYDECVDLELNLRIISSTSPYPGATTLYPSES